MSVNPETSAGQPRSFNRLVAISVTTLALLGCSTDEQPQADALGNSTTDTTVSEFADTTETSLAETVPETESRPLSPEEVGVAREYIESAERNQSISNNVAVATIDLLSMAEQGVAEADAFDVYKNGEEGENPWSWLQIDFYGKTSPDTSISVILRIEGDGSTEPLIDVAQLWLVDGDRACIFAGPESNSVLLGQTGPDDESWGTAVEVILPDGSNRIEAIAHNGLVAPDGSSEKDLRESDELAEQCLEDAIEQLRPRA